MWLTVVVDNAAFVDLLGGLDRALDQALPVRIRRRLRHAQQTVPVEAIDVLGKDAETHLTDRNRTRRVLVHCTHISHHKEQKDLNTSTIRHNLCGILVHRFCKYQYIWTVFTNAPFIRYDTLDSSHMIDRD